MPVILTIVTVTYQDLPGFSRTAASIIPQLTPEIEWIVKDGSSSLSIQRSIKDILTNCNALFISSVDNGVYDAMNTAMSHASGEWLLFMNGGDEFYAPNSVSSLIAEIRIQHYDSSSPVLISSGTVLISSSSKQVYRGPRTLSQCSGIYSYRMPSFHQSQAYSRSLYSSQAYNTSLRVSADHAYFWSAIANGAQYQIFNQPLSNFYTGGLSTMHWLTSCSDVFFSMRFIQGVSLSRSIIAISIRLVLSISRYLVSKSSGSC